MTAQLSSINRAFVDLSARVKLRVSGKDRLRFLNGQLSNDVRKASDSAGIEACVLNAKGKMEAHLFIHKEDDSFLVDADPALQAQLQPRLERFIIADDVQIEDITQELSIFHVIGGLPQLAAAVRVVSADRFGIDGHDLWSNSREHDSIKAELAKDFEFWSDDRVEVFRIEQGVSRWGRELTNDIIPVEANLEDRCIDYGKGCYIGQETISRMKISGQRNKQLRGLVSLKRVPLRCEMRLFERGKDVGFITSATRSGEREIALGYVKRGFNSSGTKLEAQAAEHAPVAVEVVDLPFPD